MERKRIRVVCPSKGRSGNVKTLKLIPDLVLVVPYDEAEDYRANHPDTEVVATPEYVKGITPTRQWILDEFGECFMRFKNFFFHSEHILSEIYMFFLIRYKISMCTG